MVAPRKSLGFLVLVLAVLVGVLAPSSQAGGDRLVVKVQEPFEFGGTVFPAGEISLRQVHEYSPVATLNEVRVNGRSLGVILARETTTAPSDRDEMIFNRNERGNLVLVSVAVKGEPVRKLVPFGDLQPGGEWVAKSDRKSLLLASSK